MQEMDPWGQGIFYILGCLETCFEFHHDHINENGGEQEKLCHSSF